ncbi:MAG: nitronate monooxygenase [Bacteroidota bacterium]|nr:nitronate monooxygenase [Bacteroidota bacterium]
MTNRICELFNIQYPIIQAGMVWCSGHTLASSVSNAGGLGLIGAGSMSPDLLQEHIQKCKKETVKPFGVNIPLMNKNAESHIEVVISEKVPIVFTSAGNPNLYTSKLKNAGTIVAHVISNSKFALKAVASGVDAVVAEGFEAGGHNGKEETTTICLLPIIADKVKIPIIAAGGIASGKSMMACFALGAEGVQIGSRFAVAEESSAHIEFKKRVINASEGDTILTLKSISPTRMIKNEYYYQINALESNGINNDNLQNLIGKGRTKKGIFEGDLKEGELEIGQISASLNRIQPVKQIIEEIWNEFVDIQNKIKKWEYT